MTGRIAADVLGDLILSREGYRQDLAVIEAAVSETFLTGTSPVRADDALVDRLLRYADILSHATEQRLRDAAYHVIALLREYEELIGLSERAGQRASAVATAVLIELGNFPGLRTLGNATGNEFPLPLSRGILRAAKEIMQATKRGTAVLTDTQFRITEKMRGEDFFSFSGPTSLGKSFILKDAIYEIATKSDLDQHCVVVLVPTKALIGQTAADLRDLLQDVPEVNVATFPALPSFLQRTYPRTVFVLTPERLLRYLSNPIRDIDYLIVDEAQKIIAQKDTRSSIYYHAIVETTRRFATKLIFASPSIQNPELFLELFGKATNGALSVEERTVSQQRYFIDLVDRKQYHLSRSFANDSELGAQPTASNVTELITSLSGPRKSIVYINSSSKASDFAMKLMRTVPQVKEAGIDELIKFVTEHIHKDYFLVKTLRHGIAFHHGKMPHEIKERIERLFADPDSSLQYVVCTSTLLEGVNLPAKNIFVLNDTHGSSKFGKIDFENLAGRAGRLTHDFSGNVVCIRHEKNEWSGGSRKLIARGGPATAESFLVNPGRKRKAFTDIGHVLRNESIPGNPSEATKRNTEQYASILLLHLLGKQQTPLRTLFVEKVDGGADLLAKAAAAYSGPIDALQRSPGIRPAYQTAIWESLHRVADGALLPNKIDELNYDAIVKVLIRLGNAYNWIEEESGGREPLVPASEPGYSKRLNYWATLMSYWIEGDPLVRIIARVISYHARAGTFSYKDYSRSPFPIVEKFEPNNPSHINYIIEDVMRDIETGLRFKIVAYLENFHDLSVQALGAEGAGLNIATLVEYGSSDPRIVNLQQVGLSRSVAIDLLSNHAQHMVFNDANELHTVDVTMLLADETLRKESLSEVEDVFRKTPDVASR